MTNRRVVVTGMGVISSLGVGVARNWERMRRGESGVARIRRFDVSGMEVKIASEVYPLPEVPEDADTPHLGIHTRFALVAGREAWSDSGLCGGGADPDRVGVFLGSGKGISELSALVPALKAAMANGRFDSAAYIRSATKTYAPERKVQELYFHSAAFLARAINGLGPNWVCITACAAGNHGVGEAYEAIRRGEADVILAGGTHSQIDLMSLAGYSTLGALSPRNDEPEKASRPFERHRDGFILGEGCGILVLEDLEHAKKRAADIRAEVIGYGNTADSHRVTDPHPEGYGAEHAMRSALKSARISPGDVDYINAHGTSTHQNDAMETVAIKRIFGERGDAPPVSATKSMIGHLIAAAGAVEGVACVRALQEGVLPPTINYETPDPACDLDYVPNEAREVPIKIAMNSSFGFGGQNIVTIFKKFED
ncbi:MAG: beta-ketoacyl-[acyl-carrier-protein] synthase family protein [Planctomycetota bacterium]|nr:beta-ketoacyl-[acyl-carrier-protein] synthase family protein [Planctomycetota bacterium]